MFDASDDNSAEEVCNRLERRRPTSQLEGWSLISMTQRSIIALSSLPIFGAVLLFVYFLFFPNLVDVVVRSTDEERAFENNYDIETFLYLGSRLLHGELLYVKDFETKLPFVQYIFFIPSLLGGIGAWRIFTFFVVLSLSIPASYALALDYLEQSRTCFLDRNSLTLLLTGFFLLLLYSLPGSESAHIEMIAASAAYLSLVMALTINKTKSPLIRSFLAGILIAVAVSIRPNYLYVFLFFALWIVVVNAKLYPVSYLTMIGLLFVSGFVALVALSFAPYLLIENGMILLGQGIKSLLQVSKHHDVKPLFYEQIFDDTQSYFYLSLYAGIAILLGLFWHPVEKDKTLLMKYGIPSSVSIVCLNVSLMQTHYWSHNSIMFVPYLIVIALTLSSFLNPVHTSSSSKHAIVVSTTIKLVVIGFIVFITASPFSILVSSLTKVSLGEVEFEPRINHGGMDDELFSFLKTWKERSNTFLVENPIYHRLLDEPRIGDGHPAMLKAVLSGRRVGPIGNIYMYSEEAHRNPCSALFNSGKDLIIMTKTSVVNSLLTQCFSKGQEVYDKVEITGLSKYNVFRRRNLLLGTFEEKTVFSSHD